MVKAVPDFTVSNRLNSFALQPSYGWEHRNLVVQPELLVEDTSRCEE